MRHNTRPTPSEIAEVNVRFASIADAVRLQRFASSLIEERLPVLFRRDRAPSVEEQHSLVEQMSQIPRSVLLVAEANTEIVGMLDFHGYQKPQRSHAGEFGMSVAREWRGMGVGTLLLGGLINWAASEGLRRLELSVFSNNPAAISLYERMGFVREGIQQGAVEVDNAYVDIILMAKTLPKPTKSG